MQHSSSGEVSHFTAPPSMAQHPRGALLELSSNSKPAVDAVQTANSTNSAAMSSGLQSRSSQSRGKVSQPPKRGRLSLSLNPSRLQLSKRPRSGTLKADNQTVEREKEKEREEKLRRLQRNPNEATHPSLSLSSCDIIEAGACGSYAESGKN
eukprot:2677489-Rhodomonas_salina.3